MWIAIPPFSAYVAASEDLTSESSWLFRKLEQSVMWRETQRAAKFWHRGCLKGGWIQLLCGRICSPSRAQIGVGQWISSLRGIRAAHSLSQVSSEEQMIHDTSGPMLGASSEKQTQLSLFSKTCKDTSKTDSTKSLQTLTNWGAMRNGVCTQRPKPGLHTAGTESSSWPTAVEGDSRSSGRHTTTTGVMHSGTTLTDAMRQWATPQSRDWKGITQDREKYQKRVQQGSQQCLNDQAAHSLQGHTMTGIESQKPSTLRLNPRFVEWLMGFPPGWTSCEPLEMPYARSSAD